MDPMETPKIPSPTATGQRAEVTVLATATITDAVGISKILRAIPALDGDIASRLAAGGIKVQGIRVHPITR